MALTISSRLSAWFGNAASSIDIAANSHSIPTIPTIRSRLALLALACVVPASLLAVALIATDYQRKHAELVGDSIDRVRAVASAVDSDLASDISALRALATSPHLITGDLGAFYRQAQEVQLYQNVNNIQLTDATGQQRLNTLRGYGTPLPLTTNPAQLGRVFDTGKVDISDLFVGAVSNQYMVAIAVPVRRGDAILYSLSATISPQRLSRILVRQQLSPEWIGAIFDRAGTIMTRTREMERFAGSKDSPVLLQRIKAVPEGSLEADSVEGIPVLFVFSRSALSGWTVAIGIPREGLTTKLRRSLWLIILATAILLAGSLCLAWAIGGRIAASVRALTAPALALGFGEPVVLPHLQIREADEVGKALIKASRRLTEAQHQAHHDVLTGLANRALLNEMLNQQIAVCARNGTNLAVLYIDLDGFKAVNDQHGHATGDELLRAVSMRLKAGIRSSDIAARLGGDEFAAMLVNTTLGAAAAVADKLVQSISAPYPIGTLATLAIEISASIGVAVYPGSGKTGDTLLQNADKAMYVAKTTGKRRYVVARS